MLLPHLYGNYHTMTSRIIVIVLVLLISCTWLFSSGIWKKNLARTAAKHPDNYEVSNSLREKLSEKATAAAAYAKSNAFNSSTCFLVDMSINSGQNRFFVYDMKADSVLQSGLVTHGRCNENWLEGRRYSNTIGGGCTSLGKYKVGKPYHGRFGLAYKLFGLDKTNDNAFKRYVVLHSHECVPSTEVEDEICQSDGCPTVSPGYLQQLKTIIDGSAKPVLLWLYE